MKKSEFPEKAYESFANHEILSKGYMIYIPSQQKENKLGYDALVHLKNKKIKAVALQYKIVHEYERVRKPLSKPAFKFVLHRSSNGYNQHNLLVERNTFRWSPIVAFYCAPRFVEYTSLYEYLKSASVLEHSCFLKPCDNIIDKEYHYITFDDTQAFQHSNNPKPVEIYSLESIFEQTEPMYYETLIEELYLSDQNERQSLDDFLIESCSILIVKVLND